MASLDVGLQTIRTAAYRVNLAWDRLGKTVKRFSKTLRHRDHVHISLSMAGAKGRTSWFEGRL